MPNTTAYIKLFRPNSRITMPDGRVYTVDHVRVSGHKLYVHFKETEHAWDADDIPCETTFIDFKKK